MRPPSYTVGTAPSVTKALQKPTCVPPSALRCATIATASSSPAHRTPDQEAAASAFVDAAVSTVTPTNSVDASLRTSDVGGGEEADRPWEAPYVREDVMKGYALRLPEPAYLKLKYVAEATGQSMNGLCREAIENVVEALLTELDSRR